MTPSEPENLDLINWVPAQNYEDNGFSGWSVQFAIWELADNYDSSQAAYNLIDNTTEADVQSILSNVSMLAGWDQAGVDSFIPQVGDTIGMIVDPGIANDPNNVQPFIVSLPWEDYDCLCPTDGGLFG